MRSICLYLLCGAVWATLTLAAPSPTCSSNAECLRLGLPLLKPAFRGGTRIKRDGPVETLSYTGTILTYSITTSSNYSLVLQGGAGGGAPANEFPNGGYAAVLTGKIYLTAGTTLQYAIGAQGQDAIEGSFNYGSGGGGGTFVWTTGTNRVTLLAAAGGGGGCSSDITNGQDASLTTIAVNGGKSQYGGAAGTQYSPGVSATGGQGGTQSGGGNGGGGASFNTGGTAGAGDVPLDAGGGGSPYDFGAFGGGVGTGNPFYPQYGNNGGFGGGGGGGSYSGGGGGGYLGGGGGGGGYPYSYGVAGGGGGGSCYIISSFNGYNTVNSTAKASSLSSHGQITIQQVSN